MAGIDRRKQDFDVMERVLGAAHDREEGDEGPTKVVDLAVRPWLGGPITPAVQMTIGGVAPEEREPVRDPDRDREPER